MATVAGRSEATWSSAPPGTGRPVVAATTLAALGLARSGERTAIALKPAVERRLISFTTSWPGSEAMNAWPSWTPQGSR